MNQLYPKGREGFLAGDAAWDTDDFRVILADADYVFSAAHVWLADVVAAGRVATSGALVTKTVVDGVADAADVTFALLAGGSTITQVIVYRQTGVEGTSLLVAYYDTKSDGTPINVATNGGDVVVQWNNGANRMFKL